MHMPSFDKIMIGVTGLFVLAFIGMFVMSALAAWRSRRAMRQALQFAKENRNDEAIRSFLLAEHFAYSHMQWGAEVRSEQEFEGKIEKMIEVWHAMSKLPTSNEHQVQLCEATIKTANEILEILRNKKNFRWDKRSFLPDAAVRYSELMRELEEKRTQLRSLYDKI